MKSSCIARTQQQGAGEDEKQAGVRQDQGFEGGGADAPVRIPAEFWRSSPSTVPTYCAATCA